jgi:hypothetical protein
MYYSYIITYYVRNYHAIEVLVPHAAKATGTSHESESVCLRVPVRSRSEWASDSDV